jgi:hypothetical protein
MSLKLWINPKGVWSVELFTSSKSCSGIAVHQIDGVYTLNNFL